MQESRVDDYWNVDVDRNLSDSWTGFRKKLKIPMEAAMPCEMRTKKRLKKLRETASENDESNKIQSFHASWKLTNPQGRVGNLLNQKDHEDPAAEKGFLINKSYDLVRKFFPCSKQWKYLMPKQRWTKSGPYNLVHWFDPMPKRSKITDAKAAVDKEWKKLETWPPWHWTRWRARGRFFGKQRTRKFTLLHGWTSVIFKMRS